MNAVRGPTAYAVGYFLPPLCGSSVVISDCTDELA